MQLLKITITPLSNFATSLKGDTIFGHLCWIIRFVFKEERLKTLLSSYDDSPFLIVSDAFDKGYLPKPKLPSYLLDKDSSIENKKESRKKIWITPEDLQIGNFQDAVKANTKEKAINVMHNSINRKTFMTGEDDFAPYSAREYAFDQKDIYCLINEELFTQDELKKAVETLGTYGYGKDASIGKGRFELNSITEEKIHNHSSLVMTLSPFVPLNLKCEAVYYEPFVRFGKKGALRANKNPFKEPLILADTAAVIKFAEPLDSLFVGQAVKEYSTHKDIVHQGYAIALPIKEIL
jgi:CRISPR-associated protein Csm4